MVRNAYQFEPDYAVVPGETLRETLEERGMSQEELAQRTGLARKTINEILNGKAPITPETAQKLEFVTRMPARFWNGLERAYQERRAQLEQRKAFAAFANWPRQFPYRELIRRGKVRDTRDRAEQAVELCRFFEISTPTTWAGTWQRGHTVRYRRGNGVADKPFLTATWLQLARVQARGVSCARFDATKFQQVLKTIRSLTRNVADFQQKLVALAAGAGVAVVFVPEFAGAAINGSAFWDGDRPIIALTCRGKALDKFWFTFFHEAMHILRHGKRTIFVDATDGHRDVSAQEEEADRLAAEYLISAARNPELLGIRRLEDIEAISAELGIHQDLVIGRIQKLTNNYARWQRYKTRLLWAIQAGQCTVVTTKT